MHIGRLIKQQLEAQDKTVSWLARELAYCLYYESGKMRGKPKFAIKHHRRKENLSLYLIEKPLEKPRDFDPFGQTGFAHLWLQYDCPFKALVLGVNFILPF